MTKLVWIKPKINRKNKLDEFEKEVCHLINRLSMENLSDTPDFILAKYLRGCLDKYPKKKRRKRDDEQLGFNSHLYCRFIMGIPFGLLSGKKV